MPCFFLAKIYCDWQERKLPFDSCWHYWMKAKLLQLETTRDVILQWLSWLEKKCRHWEMKIRMHIIRLITIKTMIFWALFRSCGRSWQRQHCRRWKSSKSVHFHPENTIERIYCLKGNGADRLYKMKVWILWYNGGSRSNTSN